MVPAMSVIRSYDSFDPEPYVEKYFLKSGGKQSHKFLLKCLARHFTSRAGDDSLRILDYGCGPSLPFSISAAPKASEIILADYAEPNREYLKRWLAKDPSAQDWSPYFKYVVQTLEGGSEQDAIKREEMVRNKVKAVVSCDIMKEEFIEDAYSKEGSYDIVMCLLCLECGCKDLTSYQHGIKKLASLLKEGGYLLLYTTRRENCEEGFYIINDIKYSDLVLKRDFILDALKQQRLNVTDEDYFPLSPNRTDGNSDGMIFIAACKLHA